jgi:RND family efflux transporter MFP subunit
MASNDRNSDTGSDRRDDKSDVQAHPASEPKAEGPGRPRSVRGVFFLVLVIAAALGYYIYSGIHGRLEAASRLKSATEEAAVTDVLVIHPKENPPIEELILPGGTQPYINSPIYARTNGYLVNWFFDIGAHVKKGDLLALIDTPELNRQLEQAQADLQTARENLALAKITSDRWQNLINTRAVSQQSTDQAVQNFGAQQATVESYAANVRRLQDLVSFEKVYAPFDGIITVRNTDIGWLIDAGANPSSSLLFQLAQIRTLRVFVAIPQVWARAARNGALATITVDQFPNRTFHGKIVRTSNAIDIASRTLNTEVDVDNPTGELLPGVYVDVHLKLPGKTHGVTIPSNTLLFRSEGLQVGVVRNDRAQLVRIAIGRDFGATVEVVSGLTPSDAVIVNPRDSLISGARVRIAAPKETKTP